MCYKCVGIFAMFSAWLTFTNRFFLYFISFFFFIFFIYIKKNRFLLHNTIVPVPMDYDLADTIKVINYVVFFLFCMCVCVYDLTQPNRTTLSHCLCSHQRKDSYFGKIAIISLHKPYNCRRLKGLIQWIQLKIMIILLDQL